jgi:hypothetical protein
VTDPDSWPAARRQAATEHAAAQRRARSAETERARAIVARFVSAATGARLPAERLRARAQAGRATYRTPLRGWYLHTDGRLAVGTDGEFYLLSVPASLRARLFGTTVAAHDPPLQVGRSAGDGESIPLAELLQRRLDAGR